MKKTIIIRGISVEYSLERKSVKNVNIRIKNDLSVSVSAPRRVTQKQIDEILVSKGDFILSALAKYEKRLQAPKNPQNRDSVRVFGIELPLTVLQGKKNRAEIVSGGVTVTLKDVNDEAARKRALESALDELLRQKIEDICREVYPRFAGYLPRFPEIKYRHMKSRWGSCNYKKCFLTFNYYLVHAPIDCVEYVVYHEFTHFIHPDHSKAFYSEVARYVPDYKDKKKRLQSVSVNY